MNTMRIGITLIALIALLVGCGQPESNADQTAEATAAAKVSWTGGNDLSVDKSTSLADVTGDPDQFVGQTLRLEGKIVGVCQGSGCWVQLEDEKGNRFYAKSVDHSIAFPKDCTGKVAVVEGEIVAQPAAGHVEEEHEHAEGEGGHECPAPVYMLSLEAAQLLI